MKQSMLYFGGRIKVPSGAKIDAFSRIGKRAASLRGSDSVVNTTAWHHTDGIAF